MKNLLAFGSFADDSQGILAGIQRDESRPVDIVLLESYRARTGGNYLQRSGLFPCVHTDDHESKGSTPSHKNDIVYFGDIFCHAPSLSQADAQSHPCENQTAPVPESPLAAKD